MSIRFNVWLGFRLNYRSRILFNAIPAIPEHCLWSVIFFKKDFPCNLFRRYLWRIFYSSSITGLHNSCFISRPFKLFIINPKSVLKLTKIRAPLCDQSKPSETRQSFIGLKFLTFNPVPAHHVRLRSSRLRSCPSDTSL